MRERSCRQLHAIRSRAAARLDDSGGNRHAHRGSSPHGGYASLFSTRHGGRSGGCRGDHDHHGPEQKSEPLLVSMTATVESANSLLIGFMKSPGKFDSDTQCDVVADSRIWTVKRYT